MTLSVQIEVATAKKGIPGLGGSDIWYVEA